MVGIYLVVEARALEGTDLLRGRVSEVCGVSRGTETWLGGSFRQGDPWRGGEPCSRSDAVMSSLLF